jgi:hypothetical protein
MVAGPRSPPRANPNSVTKYSAMAESGTSSLAGRVAFTYPGFALSVSLDSRKSCREFFYFWYPATPRIDSLEEKSYSHATRVSQPARHSYLLFPCAACLRFTGSTAS